MVTFISEVAGEGFFGTIMELDIFDYSEDTLEGVNIFRLRIQPWKEFSPTIVI